MSGIIITNKANIDEVSAAVQSLGFKVAVRNRLNFDEVDCDFYLFSATSVNHLNQLLKQVDATMPTDVPKIIIIKERILPEIDLNLVNDFVTLPFNKEELRKRLQFHLKRQAISKKIIKTDGLVLNCDSYEVTTDGLPVELTYKEFELLKFLTSNPRRVFHRQQLMEEIWEYDFFSGTRTVDVHIRRLRAKLGPKYSHHIKTVRHVGYLFR